MFSERLIKTVVAYIVLTLVHALLGIVLNYLGVDSVNAFAAAGIALGGSSLSVIHNLYFAKKHDETNHGFNFSWQSFGVLLVLVLLLNIVFSLLLIEVTAVDINFLYLPITNVFLLAAYGTLIWLTNKQKKT